MYFDIQTSQNGNAWLPKNSLVANIYPAPSSSLLLFERAFSSRRLPT